MRDGFLLRDVELAGGTSGEVTGPGDVLRPWTAPPSAGRSTGVLSWTALTPVRVALLDRDFVAHSTEWPDVLVEVASRLIHRSRCQVALPALGHVPRLVPRLPASRPPRRSATRPASAPSAWPASR